MKLKTDKMESLADCQASIALLDVLESFKVPFAEKANEQFKCEVDNFCEHCDQHVDFNCSCSENRLEGRYAREYDDEASYDEI